MLVHRVVEHDLRPVPRERVARVPEILHAAEQFDERQSLWLPAESATYRLLHSKLVRNRHTVTPRVGG